MTRESQSRFVFLFGRQVLNQARHCHFITGNARGGTDDEDSATASLQKKVYQSFTTALIQSVYDSTTDLKEILRLGRLLWPQYIEPLQADQIDKTLQAATSRCPSSSSKNHFSGGKKDGASVEPPSSEAVEGQVLAILNQKILPQIRPFLAASLYTLSAPFASGSTAASSHHELPDLAKYLLLAGYLCQVNRPDRDKHLFSIQKNGRRRKSQATENTAAENVALGSTQQQQQQQQVVQRIPRLRSFPMERLLSVYVSVVALNQGASSSSLASANAAMSFIEQSERLQSLGNNILGQHLAYLHSTGLLYDHPPRGPADVIRLSEPRYCCSLTEDEARQVAQTLNFPLDRYLLV
jgi:Origin recognition complex (ORC) subunit 5 C-terminus